MASDLTKDICLIGKSVSFPHPQPPGFGFPSKYPLVNQVEVSAINRETGCWALKRRKEKEYLIIPYWIKSLKFLIITLINWYSRITFLMLLSSLQSTQPSLSLNSVRNYLPRSTAERTHCTLIKVKYWIVLFMPRIILLPTVMSAILQHS